MTTNQLKQELTNLVNKYCKNVFTKYIILEHAVQIGEHNNMPVYATYVYSERNKFHDIEEFYVNVVYNRKEGETIKNDFSFVSYDESYESVPSIINELDYKIQSTDIWSNSLELILASFQKTEWLEEQAIKRVQYQNLWYMFVKPKEENIMTFDQKLEYYKLALWKNSLMQNEVNEVEKKRVHEMETLGKKGYAVISERLNKIASDLWNRIHRQDRE